MKKYLWITSLVIILNACLMNCDMDRFYHLKQNKVQEYCQFEEFDAECAFDEVVLMKQARFGRMNVGRCVNRDYGFIGCEANVLSELDRRCSSKRKCHFEIAELRDIYQPCPTDLTSYLEAKFSCIKVANLPPGWNTTSTSSCAWHNPMRITNNTGFILIPPVMRRNYISSFCPFIISGQNGQKINLTLFNFNLEKLDISQIETMCPFKIHILDGDYHEHYEKIFHGNKILSKFNISVPVCSTTDNRRENLYISRSSSVTLHIEHTRITQINHQSLVLFDVVGCPDPIPPRNAALRRKGDKAVIKCNHTSETWYLTCRDHYWVGTYGNCTKVSPWNSPNGKAAETFPLGLLIAVAIGVVVGILMGIFMLVFAFYYRQKDRVRKFRKSAKNLLDDETSQENDENNVRRTIYGDMGMSSLVKHGVDDSHKNYTQMWEIRRSQPHGNKPGSPDIKLNSISASSDARHLSSMQSPCCNPTLVTFKPNDPIYDQSGIRSLLRTNINEGSLYAGSSPVQIETHDDSIYVMRPDIISNSTRDNKSPFTLCETNSLPRTCTRKSVTFADDKGSTDNLEVCEHCIMHASTDRVIDLRNAEPRDQAV